MWMISGTISYKDRPKACRRLQLLSHPFNKRDVSGASHCFHRIVFVMQDVVRCYAERYDLTAESRVIETALYAEYFVRIERRDGNRFMAYEFQ